MLKLCIVFAPFLLSATEVDFVREVQPVLEKSCYSCHGAKLQMANLRLDSKQAAARTIQPGNSSESTLYQRIAGVGDLARMPMGGKPLTPDQIAVIKKWIENGAPWPESAAGAAIAQHWAFIAPQRPPAPKVKNSGWLRTPIDGFVLAGLEREGLAPSPEAGRITLLRRASLDVTGIQPTPEEVNVFLRDRDPRAYEKQVDRLLASPHYGEKWARWWLDAARYADSDGFEKDKPRSVWFYRDWVIDALNRDLPYDRFIVDQVAGDLLPGAGQEKQVATGFLRNSMVNEEGGVSPEQFRMEAMFDRMDAIGKAVLGITVQCAQCHNHKFDPITQEDYYRMFAFLNNAHEANIGVYSPGEQRQRDEIFTRIQKIEQGLQRGTPDWGERMARWERSVAGNQPPWKVVKPEVDDLSTGGQKYLPMEDGSILAGGYAPTKVKTKMTLRPDLARVTAVRLELMNDPNLALGGPGRSTKGTAALTEFELQVDGKAVKIASATASLNLSEQPISGSFRDKEELAGKKQPRVTGPIEYAIDGKPETAWGHDAGPELRNLPQQAVFVLAAPIENAKEVDVFLDQKHGGWNSDDNQSYNLGRFRLSVTDDRSPVADPVPAAVREVFAIPLEKRTPAQRQAVFSYWRTTVPEWRDANSEIAKLWQQHPEGTSQLALRERDSMRETHLLARGDFLKPAQTVAPGVPGFLHALPRDATPTRLTFARWLVDRKSPTTARALVNRVWQSYFGTGLVSTSEDLGRQTEPPSHPELLDWLAVEFMDSGWSLKRLHRLILLSAAYRQSSQVTPELLEKDPANRLIARGPRFRVDAETVRDIALSAGGLLNLDVGGPSVYPPAPSFLFEPPTSYGPKTWMHETGSGRYRRALYTFRYRSVPYPALQTFDAPNGDTACVRRLRSNTPLQALTTLNEPLFFEAAQALGKRTLAEGGPTDAGRVRYAFRRCVSRAPTADEEKELLAFLDLQKNRGAGDAWTALARVLLNLDETITKE